MAAEKNAQRLAEQLLGLPSAQMGAPAIAEGALASEVFPQGAQYGLGSVSGLKMFYENNKKAVMIGGVFVVIAVLGGLGYYAYQRSHKKDDTKP